MIEGDKSMSDIFAGVRQFQRDVFPEHRELFEQLAAGQSPKAMFVTCSDSRVDPFLLTQSRPGELFMLRNAGNIVPPYGSGAESEAAVVEYAVNVLRVPEIIVCGHSGCGTMTALVDPSQASNLPAMTQWLRHVQRVRESLAGAHALDAPDAVWQAVEVNVVVQLIHLRTYPFVAEAEQAGRLRLTGWVYDIPTGQVNEYDDIEQEFRPL